MKQTRRKLCKFCKEELKTKEEKKKRPDPYAEEIGNDNTKHWICNKCHYESILEI